MAAPGPTRRSSESRTDWETPDEVYQLAYRYYGPFTLDAAATPENAKCPRFYTEEDDALAQKPERESIWLNPPYGNLIEWAEAMTRWRTAECSVTALLPANTDTRWFERLFDAANFVSFLTPRVQFIGTTSSNTGGSVLIHLSRYYKPVPRYVEVLRWK